jgi:hypothetical protein
MRTIVVGIKKYGFVTKKEGGRPNKQPDDLMGLHRAEFPEILQQTTAPDLFSHSSSKNFPAYIH